ncbi:MAG: hypothetical protein QOI54_3726 [Actinomycetota bacterium]|jgi:pimeloyl-ACP methyl ester carboxylesterase|nr:hypothetical protein [Actinomycetota bacterium]
MTGKHRPELDRSGTPAPPSGFEHVVAPSGAGTVHAVVGGTGPPLVLLHGWPQTWWTWHKVMPQLAANHQVIVPDLRGVGGSSITAGGYDKRTMAGDVLTMLQALGHERASVVGHDIGGQVAYAFAAQHPERTAHLAIMSAHVPDATCLDYRLLPGGPWKWWWALHMVEDVADRLIASNLDFYIDHRIDRHDSGTNYDTSGITAFDRGVYVRAYAAPGALTASLQWYRAFPTDIADNESDFLTRPLAVPYLALADPVTLPEMSRQAARIARDPEVALVEPCGHWLPEQQPDLVVGALSEFLQRTG